jgi:hypothetical protein
MPLSVTRGALVWLQPAGNKNNMIKFTAEPGVRFVDVGFIPSFFHESDPRPAKEQVNDRYSFGGGWNPLPGFKLLDNGDIVYRPEGSEDDEEQDPPLKCLATAKLRDEEIRFYPHSWVAIVQPDRSVEVSRVD